VSTYINTIYLEEDDTGKSAECRVTYTVGKYYPATYYQPAEGGDVEIEMIEVLAGDTWMMAYDAQWDAIANDSSHINDLLQMAREDHQDRLMEAGDWRRDTRMGL
jgi:hypothetical protein